MASDLVLRIGAEISPLRKALSDARKDLKRLGFRAETVGRDLTTRLTLPILGVGAAAVKTFATFDRLEKGLAAVAGSAAEGKRQFDALIDVTKDARTTLDLKGAVTASLQLQAAGRSAEDTINILRQLGIAATASGAASEDVGEVGRQLAQAASKGRLLQQELRIVLERIPAISQIMKEEFGVITADAIRDAGISANEFITRLTKAIEENERLQSIQISLAKAIETFGIEVQIAGKKLGETIAEAIGLQDILLRVSAALSNAADAFDNLNPGLQKFIIIALGAVSAIGPLAFGIGAAAKTIPFLLSGFEVFGDALKITKNLGRGLTQTIGNLLTAMANTVPLFARFIGDTVTSIRQVGFKTTALNLLTAAYKRTAAAALFVSGPFLTITGLIAGLVVGFKAAYDNSFFFRNQIEILGKNVVTVINSFLKLVKNIFPNFSVEIKSVGDALKTLIAILAGVVSAIVEFANRATTLFFNAFDGFNDILNKDFSKGFAKLKESILNPLNILDVREGASALANAFNFTFEETLAGLNTEIEPPKVSFEDDDDDEGSGSGGASGRNRLKPFFLQRLGQFGLDAGSSGNFFDSFGRGVNEPALEFQSSVGLVNEAIAEYRKQLDATVSKQIVFGESYKPIEERVKAAKELLTQLIDGTLPRNEEAIARIRGEYEGYVAQLDAVKKAEEERAELLERQSQAVERLREVAETAFDSVARAMNQGASVFEAFGQAAVGAIRDVIAEQIKLAVVTAAADALKGLGILGLPLAAAAGAGAAALFNGLLQSLNIPLLADGGITQGAGLFVAGEAGPEAIIPLDRLNEFMRPGASELYGEIRADGSELLVVMQAAQARQNRSYGN
jgi:tape measure domain-containing protein